MFIVYWQATAAGAGLILGPDEKGRFPHLENESVWD
jgi:hypothetical protein